ncbi:MAG: DNA repair protein RecN [Gammaproteobacteria bacterium]|nr:DNA repair protein RecN [Gammaproteobacteria bacterium]
MLYSLSIKNFAIVESLELELEEGLTILTGETGAGKSILVDALGLALGDRADSMAVRQGCEQAEITAAFDLTPATQAWLREQSFDSDSDCLIRRIVTRNGRSRNYVNGHSATLQALRELSDTLVDIHSQHAHQSLLKPEIQRRLLDETSGDALTRVNDVYQTWKALRTKLKSMGGNAADRTAQINLLHYQAEELETLELDAGSLANLDEEHRRLAHASLLLEGGQRALDLLNIDEGVSALSCLGFASRELEAAEIHDDRIRPILDLLDNAVIHAQEATNELRHYLANLEVDPARLRWAEQRITTLQDIARKHQIRIEELPARLSSLQQQLHDLETFEERAAELEAELAGALRDYRKAARVLSGERGKTATELEKRITANMQKLGMPKGRLLIEVTPCEDAPPGPDGTDAIEFLVSTNPGQEPRPLGKVASGGELSRISLAIQVITAQSSGVETLVFDEVDVGVGGGVAEIVGQQLAALGGQRQVLCITHLPQVAAYGRHHLQVHKSSRANTTQTEIKLLDEEKRVLEIARMLGGIEITKQTLAHAREMLTWKNASQ